MSLNKKVIYIAGGIFLISVMLNASLCFRGHYLAKEKKLLENKLHKVSSDRKKLALAGKQLNADRKELEAKVDNLSKDIADTNFRFEAEKTNNDKIQNEINLKTAEIGRLSEALVKAQTYNNDMTAHLKYLNSEYDDLKARFADILNKKKKSDKKLNKLVKDIAREENAASLGTVVVKR